jgi:hypothetical protein
LGQFFSTVIVVLGVLILGADLVVFLVFFDILLSLHYTVKFFRKLLGSFYAALIEWGYSFPPPFFLFHQPNISLPYTYLETLHGDINFSPEERDIILQSAKIWERFSNGLFRIRIIFDYDPLHHQAFGEDGLIERASSNHEEIMRADGYWGMACWGLCVYRRSGVRDLYLVLDRINEDKKAFSSTFIHELGHYIGLPHIKDVGVMHPHRYDVLFPTEADAMEYSSRMGYRKDDFRYFIRF